ncbi:MAG: hypothetical protein M3071_25165, partial [Actinomycetota bacterium]|nr:hypothetical protein [Actinomycetota bacterium]
MRFGIVDPADERAVLAAATSTEREARGDAVCGHLGWCRRGASRLRRGRNPRTGDVAQLVRAGGGAQRDLYIELDPDGRELTERERASALEQLELGAVCDRTFDLASDRFSAADWDLFGVILADLRSRQRSLVLALSADPDRRALAMSAGEVRSRAFMVEQRAGGASRVQAYEGAPGHHGLTFAAGALGLVRHAAPRAELTRSRAVAQRHAAPRFKPFARRDLVDDVAGYR